MSYITCCDGAWSPRPTLLLNSVGSARTPLTLSCRILTPEMFGKIVLTSKFCSKWIVYGIVYIVGCFSGI